MIKTAIKKTLFILGYELKAINKKFINKKTGNYEGGLYRPLYSPWYGEPEFRSHYEKGSARTLVSPDRCFVLYKTLLQSLRKEGDVIECGVYKGGTAALLASAMITERAAKKLYLFDTFEGMPETDTVKDLHKKGDFSDTSLESVKEFVRCPEIVEFRKGYLPKTFEGLENIKFCFAHIDVDIYKSILDALEFIWPRLVAGGFIIFDDYGFPTCPGAREAVDEFFDAKDSIPLCLPTGQAIVFKG
jgi:O-methyltransferase